MPQLPQDLDPHQAYDIALTDGRVLRGLLSEYEPDWWCCDTDAGAVWLAAQQVVAIATPGALTDKPPGDSTSKKKKTSSKQERSASAAGRPWQDDDLRLLANAFLDNVDIALLATEFNRTRAHIKQLRLGFEAARGNLDEDQLDELSRSWIHRWQKVLVS